MSEARGLPLRVELVGCPADLVPTAPGIERRQVVAEEPGPAVTGGWADIVIVCLDQGETPVNALAWVADPERTTLAVAVSRDPARALAALATGADDFALLPRDIGWLHGAILRERDRRRAASRPERLVVEIPSEGLPFAEYERRVVERALARAGWNRSEAARQLGISRPRLQRKIERYRLSPTNSSGAPPG